MVSLINSHTNAISKRWHLLEIGLRFATGLPPGWSGARVQDRCSEVRAKVSRKKCETIQGKFKLERDWLQTHAGIKRYSFTPPGRTHSVCIRCSQYSTVRSRGTGILDEGGLGVRAVRIGRAMRVEELTATQRPFHGGICGRTPATEQRWSAQPLSHPLLPS